LLILGGAAVKAVQFHWDRPMLLPAGETLDEDDGAVAAAAAEFQ
jgi:hypothetical protein